ncbi:MAG: dihydropteroate synthase, partial [Bryobacteraceae bacterium]|nr:dihydropteroate synthase [Bryobacteraceae bacterium]
MARKRYEWKLRSRTLQLGDRTLIMGVLNVTPDSFSDGGKYLDPDRAFARAIELEEQGADIVDIGAESTRPGSQRISQAEELRRLVPVLKRLRDKLSVPISVDTYKAGVAERALELAFSLDIPFWPQLPNLSYSEDTYVQTVRGMPGVVVDHEGLKIDFHEDRFFAELEDYLSLDPGADYFAVSTDESVTYSGFLERASAGFPALRGQFMG